MSTHTIERQNTPNSNSKSTRSFFVGAQTLRPLPLAANPPHLASAWYAPLRRAGVSNWKQNNAETLAAMEEFEAQLTA